MQLQSIISTKKVKGHLSNKVNNRRFIFAVIISIFSFTSCKQTNEELFDEAYKLGKQKKYEEAIKVYSEVIKRNNKLQLAYYNRGLAYFEIKKYEAALADFRKIMAMQTKNGFIIKWNQDSPFVSEELKAEVPYNDALYQQAQVKFDMDSMQSSFIDFQILLNNNYEEKSNCLLWQ